MHVQDDFYSGGFVGTQEFSRYATPGGPATTPGGSFMITDNPTRQIGAGPLGRVAFHVVTPLTKHANNLSTAVAYAGAGNAVLVAGTGVTAGLAPDGSGATVYYLDTPRAISFTASSTGASGVTALVTGYDGYGRLTTQLQSLPATATTNNTLKTFWAIKSIAISATTSSTTIAVGTADIFGMPFAVADAGYLVRVGWAGALAQDTGTFTVADVTTPATNLTGDPRGTYLPSSASNGTNILVIGMHLLGNQCGAQPLVTNLIGVTPV